MADTLPDKKPLKNQKFTYTLIRRLCEIGTTTTSSKYGDHVYKMCLDVLDLNTGRGNKYYIAKYSMDYRDNAGNQKLIKAMEFTREELLNLAAALSAL